MVLLEVQNGILEDWRKSVELDGVMRVGCRKIEVKGAHELFTLGKLKCPVEYRIQRSVDSWKLLESEKVDCSWEKLSSKCRDWCLASIASTETVASVASIAPVLRWL